MQSYVYIFRHDDCEAVPASRAPKQTLTFAVWNHNVIMTNEILQYNITIKPIISWMDLNYVYSCKSLQRIRIRYVCTLNAFSHAVGESHTMVRSEEADNLLDIVQTFNCTMK